MKKVLRNKIVIRLMVALQLSSLFFGIANAGDTGEYKRNPPVTYWELKKCFDQQRDTYYWRDKFQTGTSLGIMAGAIVTVGAATVVGIGLGANAAIKIKNNDPKKDLGHASVEEKLRDSSATIAAAVPAVVALAAGGAGLTEFFFRPSRYITRPLSHFLPTQASCEGANRIRRRLDIKSEWITSIQGDGVNTPYPETQLCFGDPQPSGAHEKCVKLVDGYLAAEPQNYGDIKSLPDSSIPITDSYQAIEVSSRKDSGKHEAPRAVIVDEDREQSPAAPASSGPAEEPEEL